MECLNKMPMNKRINQKRVGAILQYCQIILNILISLIYSPIMLRILGQNEYGIYSVASSTISFLSLLLSFLLVLSEFAHA